MPQVKNEVQRNEIQVYHINCDPLMKTQVGFGLSLKIV